MGPETTTTPLWTSIATIAVPFVGALIPALLTWRKDANRDARRQRLWTEAKSAADFWAVRLKVATSALDSVDVRLKEAKEATFQDLKRLSLWLRDELEDEGDPLAQEALLPAVPEVTSFRKLFLLYPAKGKDFSDFRLYRYGYWLQYPSMLFILGQLLVVSVQESLSSEGLSSEDLSYVALAAGMTFVVFAAVSSWLWRTINREYQRVQKRKDSNGFWEKQTSTR